MLLPKVIIARNLLKCITPIIYVVFSYSKFLPLMFFNVFGDNYSIEEYLSLFKTIIIFFIYKLIYKTLGWENKMCFLAGLGTSPNVI